MTAPTRIRGLRTGQKGRVVGGVGIVTSDAFAAAQGPMAVLLNLPLPVPVAVLAKPTAFTQQLES